MSESCVVHRIMNKGLPGKAAGECLFLLLFVWTGEVRLQAD